MILNRIHKIFFIGALFLLLIPISRALAIGQMTQPIVINNAIKGQVIIEKLKLFGESKEDKEYSLIAEGDIKNWVQFYAIGDRANPIKSINIPKGKNIDVEAFITVSPSAANGVYTGTLSIVSSAGKDESTEGSNVMIGQKIAREVKITVTDKELIDLEVGIIPVSYQIDSGSPLKIRFQYYNKGNIDIKPEVRVQFKDIDQTKVLLTSVFPYPDGEEAIKPLERKEIPTIEVPTNFPEGRYWAFVSIWEKGESRFDNEFRFQIGGGKVLGDGFAENSSNIILIVLIVIVIVAVAGYVFMKKRK